MPSAAALQRWSSIEPSLPRTLLRGSHEFYRHAGTDLIMSMRVTALCTYCILIASCWQSFVSITKREYASLCTYTQELDTL
jgi:hypothetical protein